MMTPTRALVRRVPASFASALCARPPEPPIDVALARAQHAAYVAALASLGLDVLELPADEGCPDCCFVEDIAVVAAGVALIARSGAPSRRAEAPAVAAALAPLVEVAVMEPPATLDGGDCLRLGGTIYVGLSARTNAAGAARLAEVFAPRGLAVVPVAIPPAFLHLKSVCSPLGDDRVVLARNSLPASAFAGADIVWVPADESYGANVLAHGGAAVISDGFPRARDAIEAAGWRVVPVATSEERKADGALTCLSILV